MQNVNPLSTQEINSANNATTKFEKLEQILSNYDKAGGSNVVSMRVLRALFAEEVPVFDENLENFIYNFSVFGRAAIELDIRAGCPIHKMVGGNHVWPTSARSLMEAEPAILMSTCPFKYPKGEDFRFSISDRKLAEINKATSAARHALDPGPSSLRDKAQDELRVAAVQIADVSPGAPHVVDSHPSINMVHPLIQRTSTLENLAVQSGYLDALLALKSLTTGTTAQKPLEAENACLHHAETLHNIRGINAPDSTNPPRVTNPLLFSIESTHQFSTEWTQPEQLKGDDNYIERAFKKFVESSNKPTKKLAFQAFDDENSDNDDDPIIKYFQKTKFEYKEDIKRSAELYKACRARPEKWPSSQSKDLLEFKFVDLEKVYVEIYGKPGSTKTIRLNDAKDLEFDEKIKGVPINDKSHWEHLIKILHDAYRSAFPGAEKNIRYYFEYILKLASDPSTGIHWKDVRDLDSALRLQFSRQSRIAFGNWSHPKLKYLESKILYGNHSRLGQNSNIQKTSENQSKSTSQPKQSSTKSSSSYSNKKSKPKVDKPPKSRINFPYDIKRTNLWKMGDQPCNNWNTDICSKSDEECNRRHHICNKVGCDSDHRGIVAHA
ncbi:uncharacterized protein MELLADRAFT_70045 [Melampsora larici-populina 98AG31]|uniref:C3H1-type domain-containing protein n=1 Tax=Melampsora larici-populina (strain 98AG31 / pathotype 3-4-7) TaxID=747676 RepID=F4SDB2_MELLP|nr:uncharacterized protein MELLADRAFT_70045 [Melampsora larici-populina 98AG31]EGF97359.1 hypothetical protein MELLADRAFT_70045 [Melampsora larici-populina 98AG31]